MCEGLRVVSAVRRLCCGGVGVSTGVRIALRPLAGVASGLRFGVARGRAVGLAY